MFKASISSADSSDEMQPASWFTMVISSYFPSPLTVMKFVRKATSSGSISMPMLITSSGDLPARSVLASYPMSPKFAASLPGGIPGGIVLTIPTSALLASLLMLGMLDTSSGVLPPNDAISSSPEPSGTTIRYFILN